MCVVPFDIRHADPPMRTMRPGGRVRPDPVNAVWGMQFACPVNAGDVVVSPNTTLLDTDGLLRQPGDRFEAVDDDTLAAWLAAGAVAKVPVARKRS